MPKKGRACNCPPASARRGGQRRPRFRWRGAAYPVLVLPLRCWLLGKPSSAARGGASAIFPQLRVGAPLLLAASYRGCHRAPLLRYFWSRVPALAPPLVPLAISEIRNLLTRHG